jgi:maltose alpha-D-glucosyltransferase/alpha-amylase
MQWTPDRNAGYSSADPARLCLPTIMDPIYGYQAVNVERQQATESSLLHWTRNMLAARRRFLALGRGDFQEIATDNDAVLAYSRTYFTGTGEESTVVCVNNFSRHPQPVGLDLSRLAGRTPVEVGGQVAFPPIGREPYRLTLKGYGFYWFCACPGGVSR